MKTKLMNEILFIDRSLYNADEVALVPHLQSRLRRVLYNINVELQRHQHHLRHRLLLAFQGVQYPLLVDLQLRNIIEMILYVILAVNVV